MSHDDLDKFVQSLEAVGVPKENTTLLVRITSESNDGHISTLKNFMMQKEDLEKSFGGFGQLTDIQILQPNEKSKYAFENPSGYSLITYS